MKYSERFRRETVDQWSKCYLNYPHLKLLNNLMYDCVRQAINLNDLLKFGMENRSRSQEREFMYRQSEMPDDQRLSLQEYRDHFQKIAEEANQMFIQAYTKDLQLYQEFTRYKFEEIKDNFHMCWTFYYLSVMQETKLHKNEFAHYLEYLYVQAKFLAFMIRTNMEAEWRILQKHKFYSSGVFESPQPSVGKNLKIYQCNKLRGQIFNYYVRINKKTVKKSRQRITKLEKQVRFSYKESFTIGWLLGGIMTIIVFMCIILARAGVALEIDPIFNQYFPLWRGVSFYLFYIWMLGIVIFYFQRYKISYKIILENKFTQYPKSTDLFKIAGFFSILFVVCFIIYALELADIMETYKLSPQLLPLFVWGPFILFMFNPFPVLYHQGRMYIFKMFVKVIGSIVLPYQFLIDVACSQLFVMTNALQDTVYAVCYYTHLDLPLPEEQVEEKNVCKLPASQAKFWFTVSLHSLRIYHCVRGIYIDWGKQPFYRMRNFFNGIKYSFGLGTAVLSYLWRDENNAEIFPAWIVFAVINATYSFVWDIKMSYDLLNLNAKNFLLRDQIIFKTKNYYLWITSTFLIRCTWALYLSPNIVKNFFKSSQIFQLVIGYLQIIRRGIWNIIKIQVQQLRNRQVFRAVSKQKEETQQKLYNFIKENQQKLNCISIQTILQSGLTICSSQLERRQKNKNRKIDIILNAKKWFQQEQSQKLIAKQYNKMNDKLIKQLLENIY